MNIDMNLNKNMNMNINIKRTMNIYVIEILQYWISLTQYIIPFPNGTLEGAQLMAHGLIGTG
jgi:hypothetical protein